MSGKKLTQAEIDFFNSLSDSEFNRLLLAMDEVTRREVLEQLTGQSFKTKKETPSSEPKKAKQTVEEQRAKEREKLNEKRRAARDVPISIPADPARRNRLLGDPIGFLQFYFPSTFDQPFTADRTEMLESIIRAAKYGGDFAIAGPRGEGKTRLAMYGGLYLMFARLSNFPMVIGKSQTKSANELKTIRERIQQNERLIADFPEVAIPFAVIGGATSRCRNQTVAGTYTNIAMASDHLIFPTITREMLPDDWPEECESTAEGQIFSALGVDGPIRGTNYRDRRPTLAMLDDIENRDSAASDVQIEANIDIIEKDVAGLGNKRRVSRVMLCTTQNRKCIAYIYTDPKQKPSWNGKRFRKCVVKPDRMDLWDEYIELRQSRGEDDPDAREAFRFYRDNKDAMDAGAEMSNPYQFDDRTHADGEPVELSALQQYFSRVADFGPDAVATEDDNDPPETVGPQGTGLTAKMVQSRLSGLDRRQLPAGAIAFTVGIDVGKYLHHWTATAWMKGGAGMVVDYGVHEVPNTSPDMDKKNAERMIYKSLLDLRSQFNAEQWVDASGAAREVNAFFVDSSDFTEAVYQFIRDVGGNPWFCTKGVSPYREVVKATDDKKPSHQQHAHYLPEAKVWLMNLNADYWKRWVHERYLTPTFDDENNINGGSLSLFQPEGKRGHRTYSNHIIAEEWVSEFTPGKGEKCYWIVHDRNNHWLDSTAMASAAGAFLGANLLTGVPSPVVQATKAANARARRGKRKRPRHGNGGNWMDRVRR